LAYGTDMNDLQDVRQFFTSFFGIVSAGAATTALVLVTSLIGIAPPWPNSIVQVTAIAQLLALIFVYQRLARARRSVIDRRMTASLIMFIGLSFFYLGAHSVLVFPMPNGDLGIRGVICTSDAA